MVKALILSCLIIDIAGDLYSHGSAVVVDTDLVPSFGVIEDIFVDESHCYFLAIELLDTICFTPHFIHSKLTKRLLKCTNITFLYVDSYMGYYVLILFIYYVYNLGGGTRGISSPFRTISTAGY